MAVIFPRPSAKSNYVMKLISPEAVSQKGIEVSQCLLAPSLQFCLAHSPFLTYYEKSTSADRSFEVQCASLRSYSLQDPSDWFISLPSMESHAMALSS